MEPVDNHIHFSPDEISSVDGYLLCPGAMLSYNQIYQSTWKTFGDDYVAFQSLTINICLDGRCDVSLGAGKYTIVTKNHVAISTISPDKDFYYPGKKYEGVELYFDLKRLCSDDDNIFRALGIDLMAFSDYFCSKNGIYYHEASDRTIELAYRIWNIKEEIKIEKLRYFSICLLYELLEYSPDSTITSFFTKGQLSIVKKAEQMITENLSIRHPAREFAEIFGISESSFKLYFKGVFGMSYLDYFRQIRMQKAADLLENTHLKVAEIALCVGYENQGKFAKAFHKEYGVTPLEYRRLSK